MYSQVPIRGHCSVASACVLILGFGAEQVILCDEDGSSKSYGAEKGRQRGFVHLELVRCLSRDKGQTRAVRISKKGSNRCQICNGQFVLDLVPQSRPQSRSPATADRNQVPLPRPKQQTLTQSMRFPILSTEERSSCCK